MKAILNYHKKKFYYLQSSRENAIASRLLLMVIGCMLLTNAHGQADKRLVLAEQYFAAGDYFTAAGLYQQFLNPVATRKQTGDFPLNSKRYAEGKTGKYGNKTDILLKQADSYRLSNYWTEASALYKECYEKDPAKYASALYWYAVCQRSIGNYSIAEETVDRFLSGYATHSLYTVAQKEKQTLHFIKEQRAKPDSLLYSIKKINNSFGNDKGIFAPVANFTNQFIITSTQFDSVAAGINPYHNRLFYSVINSSGFQDLQPVMIDNIDNSLNQGAATISPDGKYLYFTQWKRDNGKVLSSIYYSTKKENGWNPPVLISSINQIGYSSKQPFCTPDGKYLFFASDKPGGRGGFDIWYTPLRNDGSTEEAINLAALNTEGNEQAPFYHKATNTLVFSSDKMQGMGGYDLFSTKGSGTQWSKPVNLGYPVNSSRDDLYFFAPESSGMLTNAIISSDRGSECCLATYSISKTNKKKMLTGFINDCKDNAAVNNAEVLLKDANGKTITMKTDADGRYVFEISDDIKQGQLFVSKENYIDKIGEISVERMNETAWHTDTLFSTPVCIERKLVIKVENVVSVYFDFDKSNLKERGIAQLDSIYNVLIQNSVATLQISGYTDGRGSAEYNKKLSDKRAKACADYLIEKGIEASRISFESFGACCPVEMELINGRDNPDGRSMNRRALINISKE